MKNPSRPDSRQADIPATGRVRAGGHRLAFEVFGDAGPAAPRVVLLHEGLGSIGLWRDFPRRLAERLGEPVLAYSRYGYGHSDVLAESGRPDSFMEDEALRALPELLDAFGITEPVLVGHSDGASIALIHAGRAGRPVRAVVAMAPHLFVEPVTLAAIGQARRQFDQGDLARRLSRHHADAARTFDGWCNTWLRPSFAGWNIESAVAAITCPVLAIQGIDDEYGTLEQVHRLGRLCRQARVVTMADCRHSPHLDQPGRVLDEISYLLVRQGAPQEPGLQSIDDNQTQGPDP